MKRPHSKNALFPYRWETAEVLDWLEGLKILCLKVLVDDLAHSTFRALPSRATRVHAEQQFS